MVFVKGWPRGNTPTFSPSPVRTVVAGMLACYDMWEKHRLLHGGLVELIVNAVVGARQGFIEWEWRREGAQPGRTESQLRRGAQ